jgi:hypothetical protein
MRGAGKQKESDEFKRFAGLAGKLVAVPKKEADKQMAKYEREKEKRPASK